MGRLKSCVYCGRIHSTSYDCPKKPIKTYHKSSAGDLRNTYRWRKKREHIKHRDKYICQVCKYNDYFNPSGKYEFKDLQVHHIVPYQEDINLCFDDDNLITLCRYHHEEAEKGNIPREYLKNKINSNF